MKILIFLLASLLPSAAMGSMIKLYCVRADDGKKACVRVVHALTEQAAKEKEAQGCVREGAKKDTVNVTNKPTKAGATGAR